MEHNKRLELLEKLGETGQQLMRRLHAKIELSMTYGITGSQFFVMKRIYEHGRVTVSALAEEIGVSLSAISALVDRLSKAGFIARSRDEEDRRLVWLGITPQGKEVLQTCLAVRREMMEKYVGQLSEEDLEQLLRIYEKLLAILKNDEKG